ncbi:right-handed parallel beta-helix repeat-containing protein [Chitinophaga vietnamensis]|uniref:right-handed parallel beta-helix repeat-containing protein n=1 Tax=Chitinophaga vietnamensis TaxID=2593957 RepID=UPI001375F4CB|nr:right-handed parallel beta-helix repeat-containing protein [Chitinophaga vietnamensis]
MYRQFWISAVLTCAVYIGCEAQQAFNYRKIPAGYISKSGLDAYRKEADGIAATAFDLTSALPQGYVKDGSVDYTDQLQTALSAHTNVVMPDFPVMVNDKGLQLKSNSNVVFRPHSAIILQPTDKKKYAILSIREADNVKVYFPVITGDRDQHKGSEGEWGMGIDIRSANNVTLVNPVVSKCWGDGICIGQSVKTKVPNNISIYNAVVDYNRRNGITVGCVKGLKIVKPVVANTSGTLPMSGIDIEPNGSWEMIDDVLIDQPLTFNNAKCGIVIGLSRLPGAQPKDVNITINKHMDDGSNVGFWMGGTDASYAQGLVPLKGSIQVIDPVWKNNATPFRGAKTYDFAPVSKFKNISIMKAGSNNEVEKLKRQQSNKKNLEIE